MAQKCKANKKFGQISKFLNKMPMIVETKKWKRGAK